MPTATGFMQLFVEHLTVIDCAYLCPTHGLVGESWICDIALTGELDDCSMVMDFGRVKKSIKQAIDQWVDHCLLVPTASPHLTLHPAEGTAGLASATLSFQCEHGSLRHTSPEQALCRIDATRITPEAVQTYLQQRLMQVVPASVERLDITLRNESPDMPYFHYVHGLKKHDGNCQRIAHGHRSRLRVSINGAYDEALTRQWCNMLSYAYIATREDITGEDTTHTHFAYDAPQGHYALSYPSDLCYIIDTDSTIECIAQHIADAIKADHASASISVRAYEGVMKGAVGLA